MLEHEMRTNEGILIVRPKGPLSKEDFADLSVDVDQFVEKHGGLSGLVICAERFPGWENLDGLVSHFKFVRDHHRRIGKVAFVSDSDILSLLPQLASHFVSAEVRHFKGDQEENALEWIKG
jgi:hypothetical protein